MKNTKIILSVVVLIILIAGGFYILNNNTQIDNTVIQGSQNKETININPNKNTPTPQNIPTTPTNTPKTYSMTDVATHNDKTNCWTAINGNVYNVTSWINQHPGGAKAIISLCGIDGSNAFNGQHGGQRRPETELANFLIGKLK